jgi:hypothetical protein
VKLRRVRHEPTARYTEGVSLSLAVVTDPHRVMHHIRHKRRESISEEDLSSERLGKDPPSYDAWTIPTIYVPTFY